MTKRTHSFTISIPRNFDPDSTNLKGFELLAYLSRGLKPPTIFHSNPSLTRGFIMWLPTHFRAIHRLYAQSHFYFWMPCPLCLDHFGGHEVSRVVPDVVNYPNDPTRGILVCTPCTIQLAGVDGEMS